MISKYRHLVLPGVFPNKIILDIDFADEAVVQCDFPLAKYFVGAINLQMISEYLCTVSGPSFCV